MFALTRDLGNSLAYEAYQYEIGMWTDQEQNQLYFYCSCDKWRIQRKHSIILRIKISKTFVGNWEFVGELNFDGKYTLMSPCGRYFSSLEIVPEFTDLNICYQQLIFRQINVKTLKYETFKISGWILGKFILAHLFLGIDSQLLGEINNARFHYTKNWGVFLILQCYQKQISHDEENDSIFHFCINEVRY